MTTKEARRPACGEHKVEYNKKHDVYYCVECDKWLEKGCGDQGCAFCEERPAKPSEAQ